jgi:putative nucleotidyltransferase with HDIG domain
MADQYGHLDLKRYLPYAIITTLVVILVPVVIVCALVLVTDPNPPLFVTTVIAVVFGMITVALGSAWWLRKPQSSEISFGDLMIWGWWRRKRAEDRLAKGTRLLGLDRSGHPRMQQTISREEQLRILQELTGALESKDPYTHGHSRRVERHVYRMATAMGLSTSDVEDLRKAAALHDVGKIRVPDRILRKPEALTDQERAVLEDHVIVGAWMVSSAGNADVVAAVRHHHEKWDGSGYPDGLSTTQIPLFARIIAVADTFDAITSTRPYRAAADRDRAVAVLRAEAGRQFDPTAVEAFISTLPAPAPAAAGFLVLLGGPRALLSRAAVLLKRAGAGALAPAAGATGAVILAGVSTFAPHVHGSVPFSVASRNGQQTGAIQAPGPSPSANKRVGQNASGRNSAGPKQQLGAGPAEGPTGPSVGPSTETSPAPAVTPTPGSTPTGVVIAVDGIAVSPPSATLDVGKDHTVTATATSGGQPVEGVTVLFSVAGSVSAAGSCATDASGNCSFAYSGPDVPGTDTVTACADANNNASADAGEPCQTASVTWTQPVVVVRASGSGVIANAGGAGKIHFRFYAKRVGQDVSGNCRLVDTTRAAKVHIKCLNVTSMEQEGNHVTIFGSATIDGVATTYQIDAVDAADPGEGKDTFQITTASGYSASGVLLSGDISVRTYSESTPSVEPSPSPAVNRSGD